jgi:FAD/FMN-containing dehydrogenase
MLFLEFHGSAAGVAEQSQRFGEIAQEFGGGPFDWATQAEDRTKLWQARHDAYWSGRALRPGAAVFATDVCVPISRLAECVTETQRDIAASGLTAPVMGHVGDGNFHLTMLFRRCTSGSSIARWRWMEPAPVSMGSGRARCRTWPPSTGRPRSQPWRRSSARSIHWTS